VGALERASKPYSVLVGQVTAGAAERGKDLPLGYARSLRDFSRRVAIRRGWRMG
jgi:hypothetical protein